VILAGLFDLLARPTMFAFFPEGFDHIEFESSSLLFALKN